MDYQLNCGNGKIIFFISEGNVEKISWTEEIFITVGMGFLITDRVEFIKEELV